MSGGRWLPPPLSGKLSDLTPGKQSRHGMMWRRLLASMSVLLFQSSTDILDFLGREMLDSDKIRARLLHSPQEFVQLCFHCSRISVLRVLYEENH